VQTILLMALMGAAGAAAAGLAVLGLLQRLRRRAMERRAHEAGLHFSAEDTFDVPRRCAAFALCAAGHSPQASNVTYGRVRGLPVRAFDFRYEAGHGTRRSTRYYGVVLVEAGTRPAPALRGDVLMWNGRDAARAPAAAQRPDGTLRGWSWRGDARQARWMADRCEALAASGLSVEVRREGVLFCFPAHRPGVRAARRGASALWLEEMGALIEALARAPAPSAAQEPRRENGIAQAVENPAPPC
jgi:hypothetical protein